MREKCDRNWKIFVFRYMGLSFVAVFVFRVCAPFFKWKLGLNVDAMCFSCNLLRIRIFRAVAYWLWNPRGFISHIFNWGLISSPLTFAAYLDRLMNDNGSRTTCKGSIGSWSETSYIWASYIFEMWNFIWNFFSSFYYLWYLFMPDWQKCNYNCLNFTQFLREILSG